jgi:hypothetical protein
VFDVPFTATGILGVGFIPNSPIFCDLPSPDYLAPSPQGTYCSENITGSGLETWTIEAVYNNGATIPYYDVTEIRFDFAAPEPGTWLMLLGGAVAVAVRRCSVVS